MNWNIFKIFKKKEKPKYPTYDYYKFCEIFPEFLFLSIQDRDDISFWAKPINELLKLDTDTKLLLVKHLKKIKKRVYFDEEKIQKILLEKWKLNQPDQLEIPFEFDDNKYNELCKDFFVQYNDQSVGAVLRVIMDTPRTHGYSWNYLVANFKHEVPIVSTASSGMRDHYGFGKDEIMTKSEFQTFLRKAKLMKLR